MCKSLRRVHRSNMPSKVSARSPRSPSLSRFSQTQLHSRRGEWISSVCSANRQTRLLRLRHTPTTNFLLPARRPHDFYLNELIRGGALWAEPSLHSFNSFNKQQTDGKSLDVLYVAKISRISTGFF